MSNFLTDDSDVGSFIAVEFPLLNLQYEIVEELDQNHLGVKYLAKDLLDSQEKSCIIQQLECKPSESTSQNQQELIYLVQLWQMLGNHPQIPRIYHYFLEEDNFYFVYEYIQGQSLGEQITAKMLDEAAVVYLLQDAVRIIDFVSKTSSLVCKIKPCHLIRRHRDSRYVLFDFSVFQRFKITVTKNPFPKTEKYVFQKSLASLGKTLISVLQQVCALPQNLVKSPNSKITQQNQWQQSLNVSPRLKQILNKMLGKGDRYYSLSEILSDLQPLLRIEQIIGGYYRLIRHLGGSESSNTYLAENFSHPQQSPCIIKQISLADYSKANKEAKKSDLLKELDNWYQTLEKQGYSHIWDYFIENGEFYLVREYIYGETLERKLEKGDRLQEPQVIKFLESGLLGLSQIHQQSLVHRNIKPSNSIWRESDQQLVLVDWDILSTNPLTSSDSNGNYHLREIEYHSPPEQIAGRATVSSDIYALGITAIEALTGITAQYLAASQDSGTIIWEDKVTISSGLKKIINKMVYLDVGKRYSSAESVLKDLHKLKLMSVKAINLDVKEENTLNNYFADLLEHSYFTIAATGILCLLASLEYTFPTLRPIYYAYRGQQQLASQPEIALTTFQKATKLESSQFLAWKGQGDALFKLERYSLALEAYDHALKYQPQNLTVLIQKGKTLYHLARYQDALQIQKQALSLEKNNLELLKDLARSLTAMTKEH